MDRRHGSMGLWPPPHRFFRHCRLPCCRRQLSGRRRRPSCRRPCRRRRRQPSRRRKPLKWTPTAPATRAVMSVGRPPTSSTSVRVCTVPECAVVRSASHGVTREGDEGEDVVEGVGAVVPRSPSRKARGRGARPSYITFNIIFDGWSLFLFFLFKSVVEFTQK